MRIILFLATLLLFGCGLSDRVTPEEWGRCEKVCQTNGGIEVVRVIDEYANCTCKNGAFFGSQKQVK